jgi:hypothetical protein
MGSSVLRNDWLRSFALQRVQAWGALCSKWVDFLRQGSPPTQNDAADNEIVDQNADERKRSIPVPVTDVAIAVDRAIAALICQWHAHARLSKET